MRVRALPNSMDQLRPGLSLASACCRAAVSAAIIRSQLRETSPPAWLGTGLPGLPGPDAAAAAGEPGSANAFGTAKCSSDSSAHSFSIPPAASAPGRLSELATEASAAGPPVRPQELGKS